MPRSPIRKPKPTVGAKPPPESASPSPGTPLWLRTQPGAVHLALRVQPRSSRNAVEGAFGDRLRVRLTAPPVDSKANDSLVTFLAERLDCPRHRVTLLHGHTSRLKTVEVRGLQPAEILRRLAPSPSQAEQCK